MSLTHLDPREKKKPLDFLLAIERNLHFVLYNLIGVISGLNRRRRS